MGEKYKITFTKNSTVFKRFICNKPKTDAEGLEILNDTIKKSMNFLIKGKTFWRETMFALSSFFFNLKKMEEQNYSSSLFLFMSLCCTKNSFDSFGIVFLIEYVFPFGTTKVPPLKTVNSASAIVIWKAPDIT